MKGKPLRNGKTSTIISQPFSLVERKKEKHVIAGETLYLSVHSILYLSDRGCEITEKGKWRKGRNILFKKMIHELLAVQFMSQQCTVGVFGGVFREGVYQ